MFRLLSLLPLVLLLLVQVVEASGSGGEFYCCQDGNGGRRACGDTLPEQCRGHAYQVLDHSGNVIKEVAPPLTFEQKADLATQNRQRKEQEEAAREQRRKDQALLDTYAVAQDIDNAQRKAEDDVAVTLGRAQEFIAELQAKHQKLEAEAEFYKKKTMPPDLQKELRATEHEIKVQQELVDIKQNELTVIRNKYDADRKRYLELTTRVNRPASSSAAR
jgi:hypothetical protein